MTLFIDLVDKEAVKTEMVPGCQNRKSTFIFLADFGPGSRELAKFTTNLNAEGVIIL